MKIALTGATGFIGRYVLSCLAKVSDIQIVIISRRNTPSSVEKELIKDFPLHTIEWIEVDIGASTSISYEEIGSPNTLVHLAWGGLPNYWSTHHFSEELPNHYRFLENLIKTGLPTLVGVGTCFEYGMQSGPLSEDISISPDNCYGYAKASLLCQLNFLKRTHEFNFSWARLFYPYGSGQGPKSLLSQLKTAVGQGDSVFNMSGGEQLRDFIKVEDVASKLAILAQIEANCGVVNICSGKPTSVRGIVEQWCREFNWEIELNLGYYPYPNYEPMAFWGESKKWNQLVP